MGRHMEVQDVLVVVDEAVPSEGVCQLVFPQNGMVEDSAHRRLDLPPFWMVVVLVYHWNVQVEASWQILVYPLKTWRSIQVWRSGLLVENLHHC